MKIITKKEDLNKPLEKNDRVIFYYKGITIEYIVQDSFLVLDNFGYNEKIFELLRINSYNFTKEYYGYNPCSGSWPTCTPGDYKALTRVVKALYEEIEKQETKKPFKSLKETHEYEKTNKEKTVIKKIQFIKYIKIKGD